MTRARVRRARRPRRSAYWCGRRGHFQADCFFREEYEKIKGSVSSVEEGNEKDETLAVDWVLAIVGARGDTPIIDSGAVCSTCPGGFAPLASLEDAAGGKAAELRGEGCEARSEVGIREANASPHIVSCCQRAECPT